MKNVQNIITSITLTQNQRLLVNALLSMLLTAIMATIQAEMQKLSTGAFDFPTLINTALVIFGTAFGLSLSAWIPAHVQDELAALRDTVAQLQTRPVVVTTAQPVTLTSIPPSTPTASSIRPMTLSVNSDANILPGLPPLPMPEMGDLARGTTENEINEDTASRPAINL